jgi:hypothetical protein
MCAYVTAMPVVWTLKMRTGLLALAKMDIKTIKNNIQWQKKLPKGQITTLSGMIIWL